MNTESPAWANIIVRIAGAASAAIALIVIFGWAFEIDPLKRVIPGLASMKPNTALCILLGGGGLWLAASDRTDRLARALRKTTPILIATIAILTLLEYATGVSFGIDNIVFPDTDASSASMPGRMAIISAILFLLLAAVLLLAPRRTPLSNALFVALATTGFLGAMLAAIGFAYGVPVLYHPVPQNSIALNTTAAFLILFFGAMTLRPDIGWLGLTRGAGAASQFARWLMPAVVLIPLAFGWFILTAERAGALDGPGAITAFAIANIAVLGAIVWLGAGIANRLAKNVATA